VDSASITADAPITLATMSILNAKIARLDGMPATLGDITAGRTTLLVNVASRCGLTPQYTGIEELQRTYADRGFTVVGVPCNQFGGQEPGSAEEIAEFCSATYGVSFPMTEKVDVNGPDRHEIFAELTSVPNEKGETGDVTWNFEKWLLAGDGTVLARFRPQVEPGSSRIVAAIEDALGGA
jgi:glutathione peroxidase